MRASSAQTARITPAPSSRRIGPCVLTRWPARTDPTQAPRLLPTPINGNSRLPCSGVNTSLASAQNCAMTITLKMPTQRKYGMPIGRWAPWARANSADVGDEEQRHPRHQPLAVHPGGEGAVGRHEAEQQQRLPGRGVALHLGAALRQDEHLARGLEFVVRGQDEEHQQRQQQRRRRFTGVDVGNRRQQPLDERLAPPAACCRRRARADLSR